MTTLQILAAAGFLCASPVAIDGDTFKCANLMHVRLPAIDAREKDGACHDPSACPGASWQAGKDELERLLKLGPVRCTPEGLSMGRVVARCGGGPRGARFDLSCQMVRSGTAAEWPKYGKACR